MDIEQFIEEMHTKYGDMFKRMAIKPECEFRITVYERSADFIAVKDNNKTEWESGRSVNDCIRKIKQSFPELKEEEGVKYFPKSKYYV